MLHRSKRIKKNYYRENLQIIVLIRAIASLIFSFAVAGCRAISRGKLGERFPEMAGHIHMTIGLEAHAFVL